MRHALRMGMMAFVMALAGARALAAPSCDVPANLPTPHTEGASDREKQRLLPIGSYTLSLIWLPQQCRGDGEGFACGNKRTASFVLHGLWPDGKDKDWPQWCKAAPVLPAATIAAHYCATPSPQLLQHEWSKHGTCMSGYTPDRYFALSNKLFDGFVQPKLRPLSYHDQTAASVQKAIADANPRMRADMMRLFLDKKGWLKEVWLCLDTNFKTQACPASQGGAKSEAKVLIWRGGNDAKGKRKS
jgi:ribonuclease T2